MPKWQLQRLVKNIVLIRNTIYEWKRLQAESGDIKAKIRGRTKGKWRKIQDLNKFKEFIDNNMDKTATELSMNWPEKISKSTI
jgi:hypothetical protein